MCEFDYYRSTRIIDDGEVALYLDKRWVELSRKSKKLNSRLNYWCTNCTVYIKISNHSADLKYIQRMEQSFITC